MVAFFDRGHAGPNIDDHARTLMAENGGEEAFRIGAGQSEFICVADAGCLDLDEDFAGTRSIELHGCDFKRFAGRNGDGGTDIHVAFPWFFD